MGSLPSLVALLARMSESLRLNAVKKHIGEAIIKILALDQDKQNFDDNAGLLNLGLDSLMAVIFHIFRFFSRCSTT